MKYTNPIISGFNPDPSICRVGQDYYLVTSSFEYFPGVPIYHSTNLTDWEQIGYCLTRKSQIPLEKLASSDGIYAPTIRYHNGRFYMITTNVKGGGNFYVSTQDPAGEWSESIWVKQSGIDPSLYFEDGKTYLTSNGTFWAPVRGIYQSEINIETGEQLTETKFLWPGTGGAYPESPHLFKKGDFYYLVIAEGGTAECHMVTFARSKDPYGPFEPCPHNPVLSHRGLMTSIQCTGHADFFEDHNGDWWAVFLGVRYADSTFHNLGRETFLAPVSWADGWPIVNGGQRVLPEMDVERSLQSKPVTLEPVRDDFDSERLALCWNYLRNPHEENSSLITRPGWLSLRCSSFTLDDLESPALLCRRQKHFECSASALIDFEPRAEDEEAGLTVLLGSDYHCEVAILMRSGRKVAIVRRRIGILSSEVACEAIDDGPVVLTILADRKWYSFGVNAPGEEIKILGQSETRFLSTEVAGGYTGAMLGMYATGRGKPSETLAHFDWFDYAPREAKK